MPHIMMAATRDILGAIRDKITGRRSRPKGASTITQQLARGLFPEAVGFQIGDVSLERKIKEALVAVQIEKRYTKSEIFTLYANQMYLGEGAYGVEAASRTYFGKSAKDLTLDEAATDCRPLPDVAQCADGEHGSREAAPRLRARSHGRGALHHAEGSRRRQGAADRAGAAPATQQFHCAYFVEEVRKDLESRYGAKQLYENGLSVQTALDVRLQEAANRALDAGLRRVDKRRGFRKPRRNILAEGKSVDALQDPAGIARWLSATSFRRSSRGRRTRRSSAHAGELRVTIDKKGFAWTGKTNPDAAACGRRSRSRHAS